MRFPVAVDTKKVTAMTSLPMGGEEAAHALIVLAHGAGNDMDHPLLVAMADGLAAGGYMVVRFNFPYREAGRKTPDPQPRLEATWLAVTDALQERLEGRKLPLVVGGKSMGGRIGAQLVADGVLDASALLFLGYPLHRAGEEHELRDGPLRMVTAPMLFLAGSKDRLCRLDLLENVRVGLKAPAAIHVVEGGDHSLDIPKSTPLEREHHRADLVAVTLDWLNRVLRIRNGRKR